VADRGKTTGAKLSKRWQLAVRQSHYRETGNWYHNLTEFPGVLWDAEGYVIFVTEKDFIECPSLQIGKELSVPKGIKSIPGYTRIASEATDRLEAEAAPSDLALVDYDASGVEGRVSRYLASHRRREQRLRDAKIASELATKGRLLCEIEGCGFDFESTYGEVGRGYVQVHHLDPLGERSQPERTSLDRLAVVCANCHVMIHRSGQCRSLMDIGKLLHASRRRRSEPASSASSAWASEGTRGIPGERRVTSRKGYSVPRRVARPRCWTGATRWSTYPLRFARSSPRVPRSCG
jgi:hypothetical protein